MSTADLIGWHGTPLLDGDDGGFQITLSPDDGSLWIGPGSYYVDGILCQNEVPRCLAAQSASCPRIGESEMAEGLVVYLDVWERVVTCIDDPSLIEPAFGGPDTSLRRQVVWQVRATRVDSPPKIFGDRSLLHEVLGLRGWGDGAMLRARAGLEPGLENGLYRIEVHHGDEDPLFKWSRQRLDRVPDLGL